MSAINTSDLFKLNFIAKETTQQIDRIEYNTVQMVQLQKL